MCSRHFQRKAEKALWMIMLSMFQPLSDIFLVLHNLYWLLQNLCVVYVFTHFIILYWLPADVGNIFDPNFVVC